MQETTNSAPDGTASAPTGRFASLGRRGNVDYVLRTMQQGLVHFSSMADAKANILLTVCSVVVTVALTRATGSALRLPLLFLAAASAVALLLAILAVLPSVGHPVRPDGSPDRGSKGFNILFFAHASRLSREEYLDEMDRLLRTDPPLYEAILRDIYGQSFVLARKKYPLLRRAYLAFLSGVLGALLLFGASLAR